MLLGSSQIDNIDLGTECSLLASDVTDLLEFNRNDGVGATRGSVHSRSSNCSVLISHVDNLLHRGIVRNSLFLGSCDVDVSLGLSDFEWGSSLRWWNEQILDLFHVDLDHLDRNGE